MWFLDRSDTNQAVQSQMARGWKFWIKNIEELYYLCSENKGADQLYCKADLHHCFHICKMLGLAKFRICMVLAMRFLLQSQSPCNHYAQSVFHLSHLLLESPVIITLP